MTLAEIPQNKKLASELSDSERRAIALRAAGKGLKTSRVTSSIPGDGSASGQVKKLFESYKPLGYQLPWEVLDYVEILSTYNPDYSQAVENIKMLSNSGHDLLIDARSELRQRRVKDFLEEKARTIQEPHGGIDGVIDKLLDQAATFGAMCGEWVLNEELTDVVDFLDINPKVIRFFWDDDEQRYLPYQKLTGLQLQQARDEGKDLRADCVKLNEFTFRYYAFDAAPGSPYGTPPFLAALANIAIQRDMVHNMAQIVKKIGLLAVIDLSIERLQPLPGETDDQFALRAGEYLDQYVDVAEEMVRDGGLVHFDDVTANTWSIGGNAAGATNIHKANEEMVFSGLKSMPSVQGRSYSTTETYAGVAYEIILRNTRKYQRAVKRMIESGYWLMVTLGQGIEQPDSISLNFKENRTLNRLQEAQAEGREIENSRLLWLLGIIDQMQVANRHGENAPKTPYEVPPDIKGAGSSTTDTADGTDNTGDSESKVHKPLQSKEGSYDEEEFESEG